MGLYPDPRTMMFLVADRPFAEALHVAWQTVPQRLAGACVVWRLSTEEQPCDQVGGGSLGAAFSAQGRVNADRIDKPERADAGALPLWLLIAGLAATAISLLL